MGNGLSPFWVRVNVGTGLDGITERHICDGSRPRADRLLISNWGSFR